MDATMNEEVLDDLFQRDPGRILEMCKKFVHHSQHPMPKYMSIRQWTEVFGYIPEGGLRHLIFSNPSFNKKVVKRLGKKFLLDVEAMELWISEQNNY